jgi:hypothetical protein
MPRQRPAKDAEARLPPFPGFFFEKKGGFERCFC